MNSKCGGDFLILLRKWNLTYLPFLQEWINKRTSPRWSAPEVLLSGNNFHYYSLQSDIYSFGVVLWYSLFSISSDRFNSLFSLSMLYRLTLYLFIFNRELITGRLPYDEVSSDEEVANRIMRGEHLTLLNLTNIAQDEYASQGYPPRLDLECNRFLVPSFVALLEQCFSMDPFKRPTVDDIISQLLELQFLTSPSSLGTFRTL